MIHELHELLSRAGARVRSLRLWASLAVCWLFWGGVVWCIAQFATPEGRHWPAAWAALAGAVLLTALACWAAARRAGRDPHAIARRVEEVHPELGALLLAALETAPSPRFKRLGYLQATVVRGAVAHGRQHDWSRVTSPGRLRLAKTANLLALVALGSACLMLADRTTARGSAGRGAPVDEALRGAEYAVAIEPGDAEIERGTTLVVLAKFRGPLPADADLVIRQDAPAPGQAGGAEPAAEPADAPAANATRRMSRSLDDPQFVGRVPNVTSELSYHVEFAGQRSASYRIAVFDYPELQRADAELNYPAYTQLEPKVIEDVRQVTAVQGTRLTLKFRLNKEVASARLVDRDGEELPLTRAQGNEPVYQASYDLSRSQRFKLHLTDRQERANKLPPDIVVNVTPNKPAAIKLAKPAKDVRVSPLEELQLAGEVTDDFGVTAYGVSYAIGGAEPTELALSEAASQAARAPGKVEVERLIDFEALEAEPDQLVSYYLWAEDLGPDGKPRRTHSDMYFAEVRHFEEIFREGQQQTQQQQREQQQQQQQGQQGAGQQAQELAELQKQVVNATWTLVRRETGAATTPELAADAAAVQEAQQQAIDQLAELGEQLSDEQSQQHAAAAQQHMEEALKSLAAAAADISPRTLRAALSAEQAAYQALLKLRAREFNVARQQAPQQGPQSGAPAGGNSASQQQLQQLELSADENRYETQSRAAANQQNSQQLEESRQILNRLAELARRQQDLNERLRELQSALEQAETAAEREELQRQLKRLRDQQQDVLRDAESLDNQMQASPNSQQMQESAEQLSETRSRVQQASEALSEGQLSQAITEGTRAERQLSQLRDDFRRQTADRFTEQMRSLRDAASQLDERQQDLGQQLDAVNADGRRSLRDAGPRQEIVDGLEQQQRELESTLETMRQTVSEAEEPEPLLAGQLYDAVQDAAANQTAEALDVARQLTEAGGASEATEAMQQAGRGVQQLREQIDRAAESVLGDETEALRRADQRLRELAEQLDEEIARATGRPAERSGGEPSEDGPPSNAASGDQPGGDSGASREPQSEERGEGSGEPTEGEAGAPGDGSGEGRAGGDARGRSPGARNSAADPNASGAQRDGAQGEAAGGEDAGDEAQPDDGDAGEGEPGEGEPGETPPGDGGPRTGESGQGEPRGVDGAPGERPGARPDAGRGGGQDRGPTEQSGEPPADRAAAEPNPEEPSGEPRPGRGQGQGSQNPSGPSGNAGRGGRTNRGGGNGRGGLDRIGEFQDALNEAERAARGPITGEDFRQWSDGMREVEDMLDDPELGAEAARIRDRAERARADYVRQSKSPDWDKLVDMVADPLAELRARIAEEIRRKEAPDALAPVDRDAAPAEFAEEVRLYYQRLGSGE